MTITAPTPMTMPSIVSSVRILFFRMLCAGNPDSVWLFMRPPRISPSSSSSARPASRRSSAALRRSVTGWSRTMRPSRTSTMRLRVLRDVRLVRHEDDGDPLLVQLLEERHHLDRRAAVEIARRLVGEQQRRLRDERARDRHALLLAARQLARLVIQPLAEPHALERLRGELPRVLPAAACDRRAAAARRSRARSCARAG